MHELKRKARNRELACGTFIFEFFEAGVPMMTKQAGGEFLILDMEHSGAGLDRLRPVILMCRAVGVAPIVRVPDSQYHHIARALDVGAQGIMVPMAESAEQMKAVIRTGKYYPAGARGAAFGFAHDDYTSGSVAEKMASLNEQILIIPLIESADGAAHADEIAALDEVDLLWIGHLDLSQSLGIPGDYNHPLFREAVRTIADAGEKRGKCCGILIPDAAAMPDWYRLGARFFSYSADLWLYQHTLRKGIAEMKQAVMEMKP